MAKVLALDSLFETVPAKNRRFREVIVFIHHYGGNKFSFSRHMDWLNELGFDCVTFNLPMSSFTDLKGFPISKEWKFGVRHIWADRIEKALGHLPQEKFIYSFSFPSVAALMAIHRRRAIDVRGWICDGGPFKNVTKGIMNLFGDGDAGELVLPFLKIKPIREAFTKNAKLRDRLARATAFLWAFQDYEKDVDKILSELPKDFPILSIRCENDKLVSPDMIDLFFESGKSRLKIDVLTLHHAGHLLGFREEPEEYKKWVEGFLVSKATPL